METTYSGRPRYTWVQQLEADTGLTADDLWNIASHRDTWRALRPIAGQADHAVYGPERTCRIVYIMFRSEDIGRYSCH